MIARAFDLNIGTRWWKQTTQNIPWVQNRVGEAIAVGTTSAACRLLGRLRRCLVAVPRRSWRASGRLLMAPMGTDLRAEA